MLTLSQARGVARSLWIYHANPEHHRRMALLYRQFIRPGDLAFDVGAHVGSRTRTWLRLGARVVAVEPVPQAVQMLRILLGRSANLTVIEAAVGAEVGTQPMLVCEREPTVSTLSAAWADRMLHERRAFSATRWQQTIQVPVTTLDALIAAHGLPSFCKIDTEGYDLHVLQGLAQALPALSFEYVPPALDLVYACLQRLSELGPYRYNWSVGESMRLQWPEWVDAARLGEYLASLPGQSNPGDVYARLVR